jgi:cation:H+ antiporter
MDPIYYLYLVAGFVLLWKGGDMLVDGADAFARSHGVPPTIAGVFILGFGTSMPELAVTALATLDGNTGIAVGNVVGSNIANVGLVLGLSAVLCAVHVNHFLLKVEIPVGILASGLAFVLVMDGNVSRLDGLILLGAFLVYGGFAMGTIRHRDLDDGAPPPKRPWFDLGKAVVALVAVVGGAELFTEGAVAAASALGVSETVIGLKLVAVGTSLPELATAIAAARALKTDLVIGNVIGSNIFNLLLVLGTAGVLADQGVETRIPQLDMPVMCLLAVLPLIIALVSKRTIGRLAGAILLLIYAGWMIFDPYL